MAENPISAAIVDDAENAQLIRILIMAKTVRSYTDFHGNDKPPFLG